MKEQKFKRSSALRGMHRRWWFWLIGGILVLSALLLVFTPFGIDYGIEYWLRSQGVDQAQVSDVDFNPFTRQLDLYGLNVTVADARVLKIEQATMLFSWSPFFKKRLQVKKLSINGLDLTIEQLPEYRFRIGGIAASLLSDQKSEFSSETCFRVIFSISSPRLFIHQITILLNSTPWKHLRK